MEEYKVQTSVRKNLEYILFLWFVLFECIVFVCLRQDGYKVLKATHCAMWRVWETTI